MDYRFAIGLFVLLFALLAWHDWFLARRHTWMMYKLDRILDRLQTIELQTDAHFRDKVNSIRVLLHIYAPSSADEAEYFAWAMKVFNPTLSLFRSGWGGMGTILGDGDKTLKPGIANKKQYDRRHLELAKSAAQYLVIWAPAAAKSTMEQMPEDRLLQMVNQIAEIHGERFLSLDELKALYPPGLGLRVSEVSPA